jgi:hypothetical protein
MALAPHRGGLRQRSLPGRVRCRRRALLGVRRGRPVGRPVWVHEVAVAGHCAIHLRAGRAGVGGLCTRRCADRAGAGARGGAHLLRPHPIRGREAAALRVLHVLRHHRLPLRHVVHVRRLRVRGAWERGGLRQAGAIPDRGLHPRCCRRCRRAHSRSISTGCPQRSQRLSRLRRNSDVLRACRVHQPRGRALWAAGRVVEGAVARCKRSALTSCSFPP